MKGKEEQKGRRREGEVVILLHYYSLLPSRSERVGECDVGAMKAGA